MKVAAYVPDLMDRSKFSALPEEVTVKFVSQPQAVSEIDADIVVGDLGRPGVVDALAKSNAIKVGFVSHVDSEARHQAVTEGIRVFTRSVFFSRLAVILTNSDELGADRSD